MKIVIAPDKFKGSLDAASAAAAIERGVRRAAPGAQIDCCPVADGGEGTVSALVAATGGQTLVRRVTGPLPEMKVDAVFGRLGDGETFVIEMAAAAGLALLAPADRDPLSTTTFGVGELLVASAELGARRIILGIGGSATNDAGVGAAQACGLPIILEDGEPVSMTEPICGRDLDSVVLIKHGRGSPVERTTITVACDVTNPLFGPDGATQTYGPQKGASPATVARLDDSLRRLATRLGKLDQAAVPGAGAAGGLGFGMLAFFGAELRSGVAIVLEALRLADRLVGADLCITGEGQLDRQSRNGKAPAGVARLCQARGIPCIALVGSIGPGAEETSADGITSICRIHDGSLSERQSMREAARLLEESAERVTREFA